MITFNDSVYNSRRLEFEGCEVLISTTNLNEALFSPEGKYLSEEAELIDNQIFYFVEKNEIGLSDKILVELLKAQIK